MTCFRYIKSYYNNKPNIIKYNKTLFEKIYQKIT